MHDMNYGILEFKQNSNVQCSFFVQHGSYLEMKGQGHMVMSWSLFTYSANACS